MYKIEKLSESTIHWFVEVAGVNMLNNEVNRPELVDIPTMYGLADRMMYAGTAWVVLKDDEPIGTIGAMEVPNIYNPNVISLAELVWYVLPEHRNSRAALMLLNVFDKYAEEHTDDAIMSLLPSSEVSSLERRGYHLCEQSYRKVFSWPLSPQSSMQRLL